MFSDPRRVDIDSDADQIQSVLRILAGAELLLLSMTWRLWLGVADFPVVPLLRGVTLFDWLDRLVLALFALSLLGIVLPQSVRFASGLRRCWPLVSVICGALLVTGNIQRLQVWHWLYLLCAAQVCLLSCSAALRSIRLTVAMIYVCSALSRLSLQTPDEITVALLQSAMNLAGPGIPLADREMLIRLSLLSAGGEFLIGVFLLVPRTRPAAVRFAVVLHVLLIVALGPIGLGHHAGVVVWNLMFLILNPVLFSACANAPIRASLEMPISVTPIRGAVYWLVCCGIVLFPLSGLIGIADNWPSWQVYSQRPEVWRVFVRSEEINQLDPSVRVFCQPAGLDQEWTVVRIDRWSLDATGTPLYPEDRFQLAVIESVMQPLKSENALHVVIFEPGVLPWQNKRERRIQGRHALQSEHQRFVLNSTVTAP